MGGKRRSAVGDPLIDRGAGDFSAIPRWAVYAHVTRSSDQHAVLFHVNDFPVLKALDQWRGV